MNTTKIPWKLNDQMEIFLRLLNNNKPFAFAHFNDGELNMIIDPKKTPPSREQKASTSLSHKLKTSLIYKQKNYFPGLPCSICYPHLKQHAILLRTDPNIQNVLWWHALAFHHTKISYFTKLISSLKTKTIHWVINDQHNLQPLHTLGLDVKSCIKVQHLNAFDSYEDIFHKFSTFKSGDVVILLCGCLGRVLAQEWFAIRKDVSFLCLGSYFDSHIRNKKHLYDDIQQHKQCNECYDKSSF